MDSPASSEVVLRAKGLSKRFGATQALDAVDFELRAGEIHALVGENGAGKSTFIKILAGVHAADGGTVASGDGRSAPADEMAFIHQDLGLVNGLSVAENIYVGSPYPRRGGLVDWRAMREGARRVLGLLGVDHDPKADVATLRPSDRAEVAIARALRSESRILVLDEPTAMLPGKDVDRLFTVLKRLREQGVGILYVSHRLREVLAIADQMTVFRDGRVVFDGAVAGLTEADVVEMMTGAQPEIHIAERRDEDAEALLAVSELTAAGLGPLDLTVGRGEVIGCVGLRGAGQSELAAALVGLVPASGTITFKGAEYRPSSPAQALRRGIVLVSGSRDATLVRSFSIEENLFMNPAFTSLPGWVMNLRSHRRRARELTEEFGVVPADPTRAVGQLSGGNAQKVVVGRGLESSPDLVVMEDPTAGVDTPTRNELYRLMAQRAAAGTAFLVVSSDHDEVAQICKRVHVFQEGRIVTTLTKVPFDPEEIATLCAQEGANV